MDTRTTKCGIVDMSIQISHCYCDVKELAEYLQIDEAKYTIGLGLETATACAPNEDAISLGLSTVRKILLNNNLTYHDIGMVQVGTMSNCDGAMPVKSYIMGILDFKKYMEGCDVICGGYGGTKALLDALSWVESPFWDGKYALVVCTDTCFYNSPDLMPLSGSAACAMLIGKNPVFEFYTDMLMEYSEHIFDMVRPRNTFPIPQINGKLSVEKYKASFSHLFKLLKSKSFTDDSFDHICFHTPYSNLPIRVCEENGISLNKVEKSLIFPKRVGNPYTASLYLSLYSLIRCGDVKIGENILMFSYGSGVSAGLYLIKKVREGITKEEIFNRKQKLSPSLFVELLDKDKKDRLFGKELSYNHKCGFVTWSRNAIGRIYYYTGLCYDKSCNCSKNK